jgi:hypothetical protein
MTDLNKLLSDADPVREDRGLSEIDAERMRRVIVSAALEAAPARTPWLRPFAVAGVGALLVVFGTLAGHRAAERPAAPVTDDPLATLDGSTGLGGSTGNARRQLQFSTPGGTRIIWVFDQNLRLQESMP